MSDLGVIRREDCTYTSHYCEENVWMLCDRVRNTCSNILENCYSVFISNNIRGTPLWQQRVGSHPEGFVIWDYHVFFLYFDQVHEAQVYDFDTLLPFPCPLSEYLQKAIRDESNFSQSYCRYFRVVAAGEYLCSFSSDRTHMKCTDGSWLKPPPHYPCIFNGENNLDSFISMEKNQGIGKVLNLNQFISLFCNKFHF